MAFIYKTTNLISGKIYIGQHNGSKKWYLGSGKIILSAIKKYGRQNFKREIITSGDFDQDLLNDLETHFIQIYNSTNSNIGYNLTSVTHGAGGDTNRIPLYLINLKGDIVKKYQCGLDIATDFNCRSISYKNINKPARFRKRYRIVTPEFYEDSKKLIINWEKFDDKYYKIKYTITKNKEILTFKSLRSLSNFLNVREYILRWLLKCEKNKIDNQILHNKSGYFIKKL